MRPQPITSEPPVPVEFTAAEFTQLANLVYRAANADNQLTRDILDLADDRGLLYKYREAGDGFVASSVLMVTDGRS